MEWASRRQDPSGPTPAGAAIYACGDEVVASLPVAEAFGHLEAAATASALALCDRVLAMLRRLTR